MRIHLNMWRLLPLVAVLVSVAITSRAAPAPGTTNVEISGTTTALMYLSRFGYMNPSATNPENGALLSEEAVRSAIIEFQAFAGLNQTGDLDPVTKEMMNMPRCGNRDIIGHGANTRRKKRYALQGSRWRVRDLTYKITKYPSVLGRQAVDREVAAAFQVWEDVSNLSFKPATSGKVHIEVRFEKGEHGDGDPFDGRGGTLAHAYFPIYGGDAHFDDTEQWTIDSYRGTNLFQVAAHEFGHSLGLSHSDVRSALMAPFYRGFVRDFKLDDDDTKAIQVLYGKKEAATTPATPSWPGRPTTTTARPSTATGAGGALCQNSKIDAIVSMADENTYVFKGSQYWLLTDESTAPGYPKMIANNWEGVPSSVDAAFTWVNGKTYFFKGSEYWRVSNMTVDLHYPKPISKGFAGIPNDIDAAFVWSGNGKIYFFKNDKYWRFEPTQRPPVREGLYPKDISNWEGIPNNIDDALQYSNGFTYFFKNGQYWRFNDRAFRIDTADPPFPRPVGYWWFGCSASSSQTDLQSKRANVLSQNDLDVHEDSFDADGSNALDNSVSPRFSGSNPHLRDDPHQNHLHQAASQHYDAAGDSSAVSNLGSNGKLLTALLLPLFVRTLL